MSKSSLILVILQFTLIGYIAYGGLIASSPIPFLVQILGVGIALCGIVTIKIGNFNIQPEVKSSQLVISGPFKYIRNPMYLGILLVCFPAIFNYSNALRWIALGALIVVLLLKILKEEGYLLEQFGTTYSDYVNSTKRLIPYIF